MLRKLAKDYFLSGLRRQWQSQAAFAKAAIDSVQCDNGTFLQVKWADGKESKFPYVWLRDNSPDPTTYNITQRCKARKLLMEDLSLQVQPEAVHLDKEREKIVIKWPEDLEVSYDFNWLSQRDMGMEGLREQRAGYYLEDYQSWGAEEMAQVARPASFAVMMTDDACLAEELERFLRFGFLLCKDVLPNDENQVRRLGDKLGYMFNCHYGSTFAIKSSLDPSNIAFTRHALELHTDMPCLRYPPHVRGVPLSRLDLILSQLQIQILHCVKQAGKGGESQFVDGFRVAINLQKERPPIYDILTSTPLEYIDCGEDSFTFHSVHRWPVIKTDSSGRLQSIFLNNAMRSWFLDVPVDQVPKVYEALKVFHEYCYQPRHLLQMRLQPGEMVLFANNRVMHGRNSFEAAEGVSGERHFVGGYMNFDAAESRLRVILQRLNKLKHASI